MLNTIQTHEFHAANTVLHEGGIKGLSDGKNVGIFDLSAFKTGPYCHENTNYL